MFDANKFKRSVKEWVRSHPNGTMEDLVDYCEELIPPTQHHAYGWLIDQTAGWYDHVLQTRRSAKLFGQLDAEDCA
jgi:hypothetical protein